MECVWRYCCRRYSCAWRRLVCRRSTAPLSVAPLPRPRIILLPGQGKAPGSKSSIASSNGKTANSSDRIRGSSGGNIRASRSSASPARCRADIRVGIARVRLRSRTPIPECHARPSPTVGRRAARIRAARIANRPSARTRERASSDKAMKARIVVRKLVLPRHRLVLRPRSIGRYKARRAQALKPTVPLRHISRKGPLQRGPTLHLPGTCQIG